MNNAWGEIGQCNEFKVLFQHAYYVCIKGFNLNLNKKIKWTNIYITY